MKCVVATIVLSLFVAACGSDSATDTQDAETSSSDVSIVSTTIAEAEITTTTVTIPASTTTEAVTTVGPDAPADDFLTMVLDEAISVSATSPDGGVNGHIMVIAVTNNTDESLEVEIPCGFVLVPPPEEQRMMVVEPTVAEIAAGATAEMEPFVVCADSSAAPASEGAVYLPGYIAEGDLLTLAACLCERDLSAEIDPLTEGMDIQFAVWAAADGELPELDEDLNQLSGALGDLAGENLGFDLEELSGLEGTQLESILPMIEEMLAMFGEQTSTLLEECGVDLSD